jgi:hypothetical protein
MSLTQVFDRPVQGRHFFDAVIRENLDLGRPDRVGLLFPLRITRTTPPPAYGYRTRVITDGVQPSLHVEYKHSHVKQYFKEQHALRTETTINNPKDFYINKGLENPPHLRELGHQVNRKLLEVERVSHQCVFTQDALDRLQRPTRHPAQDTRVDPCVDLSVHVLHACIRRHDGRHAEPGSAPAVLPYEAVPGGSGRAGTRARSPVLDCPVISTPQPASECPLGYPPA